MSLEWSRAAPLRRGSQAVYEPVLRALWGLRVEGRENLPESGPLIIAGNHVALLDGPLLAIAAAPRRCIVPMAKAELFEIPGLAWYLRAVGTIPLERKGDLQAMRAALEHLKAGGCLGLFPEGTRSKTGLPGKAKAGVGFLAAKSQAAVVPARLFGTDRWPLARLKVRFGAAVAPPPRDADRDACVTFSDEVLTRVFQL